MLLAPQALTATHWLHKAIPRPLAVAVQAPVGGQLVAWLRARARAQGIELTADAAALLVQLAGDDLTHLCGEVEKAALAGGADNRRVSAAEVRAVVGETRARHVFDLTRALVDRDRAAALALLNTLLGAGEDPFALLGMLAREARAAWRAADGLSAGRPEDEIARELGPAAGGGRGDDRAGARPATGARGAPAPALLGGRAPPEARRRPPRRAVAADRGSVRGLIPRAGAGVAAALLAVAALASAAPAPRRDAAPRRRGRRRRARCPAGTPLGGYGGFPRRAFIPDFLGRFPYAFWFRPSIGVHDPMRARSLVLEAGSTRVAWLTVDLVGIDPALVARVGRGLRAAGLDYSAIILAASHTHSGPGAYADSVLFGLLAVDLLSPPVRDRIVDGLVRATRQAEAGKSAARVATGRADVTGIAESRVQAPARHGARRPQGDDAPTGSRWRSCGTTPFTAPPSAATTSCSPAI